MKQPKQTAQPVKSARKTAKSELKARLLTTLKNILEQDKIKLTKKIKKQSKKLVKAVANELVIPKSTAPKAEKPAKAAAAPKVAKAQPAAQVKKAAPKATPAKATTAGVAAKSKTEKK
jgi:hypothetical protein